MGVDGVGTIPTEELPTRVHTSTSAELEREYSIRRAHIKSNIQELLDKNAAITGFCKDPEAVLDFTVNKEFHERLFTRQYPIADAWVKAVNEILARWRATGKIVDAPQGCRFNSPLLAVAKKDENGNMKGVRVCIDLRQLNKCLNENDRFQIPHIPDMIGALAHKKLYAQIDCSEAFGQWRLADRAREFTAFTWQNKQEMFAAAPFGIKTMPSLFQRFISRVFADMPFVICYIDNIAWGSASWEEHELHAVAIMERLNSISLRIKPEAVQLGQSSISLLGHIINEFGVGIDPEKQEMMLNWPLPAGGSGLASFLGLGTFLRDHIRHYAELTAPLEKVKKQERIDWEANPLLKQQFENVKRAFATAPFLSYPDFSRPFVVAADSSQLGLGGVLYQPTDEGHTITKDNIIAICSHQLNATQHRYPIYKKELWAVVYCLRKFHLYIYGKRNVNVYTDHKPLIHILKQRTMSQALQQYIDVIMDYVLIINYRPGLLHVLPDALSRMFKEAYADPNLPWGTVPNVRFLDAFDKFASPSDILCKQSLESITPIKVIRKRHAVASNQGEIQQRKSAGITKTKRVNVKSKTDSDRQHPNVVRDEVSVNEELNATVSSAATVDQDELAQLSTHTHLDASQYSPPNFIHPQRLHNFQPPARVCYCDAPTPATLAAASLPADEEAEEHARYYEYEPNRAPEVAHIDDDELFEFDQALLCAPVFYGGRALAVRAATLICNNRRSAITGIEMVWHDGPFTDAENREKEEEERQKKQTNNNNNNKPETRNKKTAAKSKSNNNRSSVNNVEVKELMTAEEKLLVAQEKRGKQLPATLTQRADLITDAHARGHFGEKAMLAYIDREDYWWPGIRNDIKKVITSCPECIRFSAYTFGFEPSRSITASMPGDHYQIDLAKLPTSIDGYNFILVLVDVFSGFAMLRTLKDKTAQTTATALWEIFSVIGIPKILQSDNGGEFRNVTLACLNRLVGVSHRFISAYNPRSDGKVERTVKTVKETLVKLLHGASALWPSFIPFVQLMYNTKVQEVTGSSPFCLMYGRKLNEMRDYTNDPPLTIDTNTWQSHQDKIVSLIFPAINERVKEKKSAQREQLDKTRKKLETAELLAGSIVFIRDPLYIANPALRPVTMPPFIGPYTVVRRTQNGPYILKDATDSELARHVNIDQMRVVFRANPPPDHDLVVLPIVLESAYTIEQIIGERMNEGVQEYKVKWKSYPLSEATWEPVTQFDDFFCIEKFWKARMMKEKEKAQRNTNASIHLLYVHSN